MQNAQIVTYQAENHAHRLYLAQLEQQRIELAREWQGRYAARQVLREAAPSA